MRRITVIAFLVALFALPQAAAASPLNFITISPSVVNNGASATGLVSLSFLDPAPTTVLLFSSDPSAAQVPASIVVPANTMETTFTITTNAAAPPTGVQISAWVGNVPRTANMSVNTAPPPGPTLSAISVSPSTITGGAGATGTVTFTGAMTQGANVQLTSSNTAVARVPAETTVSAGASKSTFAVTTSAVTANTSVTLKATWLGIVKTTTIVVAPGAAPAPDRVTIRKAEWKRGLLTIEATSTNLKAILSVYTSSGGFMFTLTNKGGGTWFDQRGWVTNPIQIQVRSNFGGSATARLTS